MGEHSEHVLRLQEKLRSEREDPAARIADLEAEVEKLWDLLTAVRLLCETRSDATAHAVCAALASLEGEGR